MLVRFKVLQDRLQSSLFFVPMLFVLGGAALGELMLYVDDHVEGLPTRLTATVDSARNVLSTVASATLAFAGIAFSVSLLLISLASSQYSPRVVHGLFRDPFNKRVMGVVIGTFTYCLVVLRAVRGPLEETGQAVVPSISILLAVLLGVISILSIVAFISHGAHLMDVSKILHGVTEEAIERIRDTWPVGDELADADDADDADEPVGDGQSVAFDRHGWVQQIDHDALFDLMAPGSCLRLDTAPGRYAIPDTPLCSVWPRRKGDDSDEFDDHVRNACIIGETRTMQQDVAYGVRQLADVALKALSPGINDPTTAQDALFHLGSVVRELLVRKCPPRRIARDDRVILRPHEVTHQELIAEAFDEVRLAAAAQPTVLISLLEILHLLSLSLGTDERSGSRIAIERQAGLVLEISQSTNLPSADHERVRVAYHDRFTP